MRPRKRIRKYYAHKSFIAKESVERGHEHITKKGRVVQAKTFDPQVICKCLDDKTQKLSCSSKIDVVRQKEIFDSYYQHMNWSQKTLFLRACVKREPVKTKKVQMFPLRPIKSKEFNHIYTFLDKNGGEQIVCRDFFIKCIQVTSFRIFNALKTFKSNSSAIEKRGKGTSSNKTSDIKQQSVREFIDRIPKYESHYGRSQSQRKYLHHSLDLATLYREYKGDRDPKSGECVSEYIFRRTFNTEYNLGFKRRHTDTCRTCDEIFTILNNNLVSEECKKEFEQKDEFHKKQVEDTRSEFNIDVDNAMKSDGKIVVLTFDLQKTLETPSLTTSVAFYSRQLWTYNLCIYDEVEKRAYMYIWSEDIASRGGQEIGSCLLKHIKDHVSTNASKIIAYSDRCGGQNRNINLTLLLKKCLHDLAPEYSLKSITQKYFVSGHSYNSCDRSFGLIEKQRKMCQELFVPNDWFKLIKETKKSEPKFKVTMMESGDFVSSNELKAIIVNRKTNTEGIKINWLNIRQLKYRKDEAFHLHIVCNDSRPHIINIQKKKCNEESLTMCDLPLLYPNGKLISKQKYDDLIKLLKYVPAEHHSYFTTIKYDDEEKDYGLASDMSDND